MTSELINTILSRRSIRSYTNQPLSEDTLHLLLKAGMAAPTAMHMQPWEFLVITDKAMLQGISEFHPFVRMAANAAAAIAVCGNLNIYQGKYEPYKDYWVQDTSAATENILLAAEALGVGAVWTGLYPIKSICEKAIKFFNLPPNIIPLNVIVLGYPAHKVAGEERWQPEKIHLNKY